MKKIKHSKYKNTGILFELLVRQITSDTLNNVSESKAGSLIRKYFHKSAPLSKELSLYQTLIKEKFNTNDKAKDLVEAVVKARISLNNKTISREKYNLIKEIKENWNIDDFFSSRVSNYKVLASIYNLFEYKMEENPKILVESKHTLYEHITFNNTKKEKKIDLSEELAKEDKEIRNLAYKLMLDKFNGKYSKLDDRQKKLLETYITNVSNTTAMKDFINVEKTKLLKEIKTLAKTVDDGVTKIKLKEVVNILNDFGNGKSKVVRDEEVLGILRYYELSNELKKVAN